MVNSVEGLLQINEDYSIKKTSVNIDTPVYVGSENQTGSYLTNRFHLDSGKVGHGQFFSKNLAMADITDIGR